MKNTIIYGASDDLIEIRGGKLTEEFDAYCEDDDGKCGYLACSDGTLLSVVYDGEWKFHVDRKGELLERVVASVGEEGEHIEFIEHGVTSYSDIVVFKEGLKWILSGEKISK